MLNYSNTHRKDPNIKSNALKCAITLAIIFLIGFVFYNYNEPILNGLEASFTATCEFLKPMFKIIGYYILWCFGFASLWSICVFCKIKPDCLESNTQWQKICHVISVSLVIYTMLYCTSLEKGPENSLHGITAMCFLMFGFLSNVFIAIAAAARRDDEKNKLSQ